MIAEFQGEYRFLSNFYIEPDGTHVEREYQQSKCRSILDRAQFDGLTPGQCKRLGRRVKLRDDWESIRLDVMLKLVRKKFRDHGTLAKRLLDTGNIEIVEGNNWGDTFWGVCRGKGENHLGIILMTVRAELFAGLSISRLSVNLGKSQYES